MMPREDVALAKAGGSGAPFEDRTMTTILAPSRAPDFDAFEELVTWTGFRFRVRRAAPSDRAALSQLFDEVSADDRRFRFLSAVRRVDQDILRRLTEVDHDRAEDFLAFDGDRLIASAMVQADSAGERAEVAIAIDAEYKNRGIGWALLDHVVRYAAAKGIQLLESIECRDNVEAIALEQELGFTAAPYPGDATLLLLQKRLGPK